MYEKQFTSCNMMFVGYTQSKSSCFIFHFYCICKKANRFLVAVMNELIFNGHTDIQTQTHDYEIYHTELTTFLYAIH